MHHIRTIYLVCALFILSAVPAQAGTAEQCLQPALEATKAAIGSPPALSQLYDIYFGESLAKKPVSKKWKRMSRNERRIQIDAAKHFVLSLSQKFAGYARATFVWKGSVAYVTQGDEKTQMQVYMSGKGCQMADICIKDSGCLSSYIGDTTRTAAK